MEINYFMAGVTIVFAFITVYVGIHLAGKSGTQQDIQIRNYFLENNSINFTNVMSKITRLANVETIFIIAMPILFFLVFEKEYITLSTMLIGALGSIIISHGLKLVFRRLRPTKIESINHFGYSYPSGHAATGMGFYVTVSYVLFHNYAMLPIAVIIAVILGLLIALSRITLGVYWLSDVVIGVGIGLLCSYWAVAAFNAQFYFHVLFG